MGKGKFRLSVNEIRNMIPKIANIADERDCYYPKFCQLAMFVTTFVDQNPELTEICKAYENKWEREQEQKELQQQQQEKETETKTTHVKEYVYEYTYVRHYDPDLYKKQISEHGKGDGNIDHRIQEKDIPPVRSIRERILLIRRIISDGQNIRMVSTEELHRSIAWAVQVAWKILIKRVWKV